MYNNARRAQLILSALREFYEDKFSQQQLTNTTDNQLKEADMLALEQPLALLGIQLMGVADFSDSKRVVCVQAEFRGVSVILKLDTQLNPQANDNAMLKEILARDYTSNKFGLQTHPQQLPFDETCLGSGKMPLLDMLKLSVRGQTAYAVIQESQAGYAGELLDQLADNWIQGRDLDSTVRKTLYFLFAMANVLTPLHSRGGAHGGDPRDYHLADFQNGHGMQAAGFVSNLEGKTFALLLGGAENFVDPSLNGHSSDCERRFGNKRERSRDIQAKSRMAAGTSGSRRISGRLLQSDATISHDEIRRMVGALKPYNPSNDRLSNDRLICCNCRVSCVPEEKRKDLRRAAQCLLNVVLGKSKQATVLKGRGEGCTADGILQTWLALLSDQVYVHVTGIHRSHTMTAEEVKLLHTHVQRRVMNLEYFLITLAEMLGPNDLQAASIRPKAGFDLPSRSHPQGLDSMPADLRINETAALPPANPLSNTQHYFVAGGTVKFRNKDTKLIAVWLVYTWSSDKQTWYRSVLAAEPGAAGDLAALYRGRVSSNEGQNAFLDICYHLKIPSGRAVIDANPRSIHAAHSAVRDRNVGMFLNSNANELGIPQSTANCGRDWDPLWSSFGRSIDVPENLQMGLKLTKAVKMFDELKYNYLWAKSEVQSGKRTLEDMCASGGGQAGKRRSGGR
jgi:hypothetical protein